MRIEVLVPSRDREQSMQAVLVSLHALSSGEHNVRYTVLCDDDDVATRATALTLQGLDVRVISAPRALINKRENEIIMASDAEAFMPWADDLFALTPAWDEVIASIITKADIPAFSWQEAQDPKNHTAIVLTRKWVRAAGRFFPEHFPFWFADTWLKEVFWLSYGQEMPLVEHLRFSHKREPTTNMHDLGFWFRVFAATRGERVEDAKRIAAAYGLPPIPHDKIIPLFERADRLQMERVPQFELIFGAGKTAPSAAYLEAKAKAEKLLQPMEAAA
jgi:hypothetical protein